MKVFKLLLAIALVSIIAVSCKESKNEVEKEADDVEQTSKANADKLAVESAKVLADKVYDAEQALKAAKETAKNAVGSAKVKAEDAVLAAEKTLEAAQAKVDKAAAEAKKDLKEAKEDAKEVKDALKN